MAARGGALDPRRRPSQRRSRDTVGFVLEAAAQLFGARGYAGTTTNHVAERAGVSIGTVYQYFPNKDALLLELARLHVQEAGEALRRVADELRASPPTLEELVGRLVDAAVEQNRAPVHAVVFSEAPRTPELTALLRGLHEEVGGEVAGHLRRLGVPVDPELAATVLTHLVDALVHEVVLHPPAGRTRERCAEEVVAVCLGYLGGAAGLRPGAG